MDTQSKKEADIAFERAKKYTRPSPPSAKVSAPPCTIVLHTDQMQLSHILALKHILRSHAGASPIEIHFELKERLIATIHIQEKWGVRVGKELEQQLRALPIVKQFTFQTSSVP